jgi:hypothetical protein
MAPSEVTTDGGSYTLALAANPQPFVAGEPAELLVTVAAAGLAVEPWMPDMGHGLADPVAVQSTADGFAADWSFSMPGYWELTLTVDGADGLETATVGYEVQ